MFLLKIIDPILSNVYSINKVRDQTTSKGTWGLGLRRSHPSIERCAATALRSDTLVDRTMSTTALPSDAAQGIYQVLVNVTAEGLSTQHTSTFTVN